MKLGDILIWIFFILALIIIGWYIFRNSPTFEQAILILILGLGITAVVKISVLETRFNYLARDFRNHIKES